MKGMVSFLSFFQLQIVKLAIHNRNIDATVDQTSNSVADDIEIAKILNCEFIATISLTYICCDTVSGLVLFLLSKRQM